MDKKKHIAIPVLVIVFAGIIFCALIIQNELNDYKTGFYLKGTYRSGEGPTVDAEYLAFSREQEDEKLVFYYYKQLGVKEKGNYSNTGNPNIYRLSIDNASLDGRYILVDKENVYFMGEDTVLKYKKFSDVLMFINVL